MADGHKSRRFKDLQVGDLFTFNKIIFTKIKIRHDAPGAYTFNAISDTTTGSTKNYFAPNTIVEKLDE